MQKVSYIFSYICCLLRQRLSKIFIFRKKFCRGPNYCSDFFLISNKRIYMAIEINGKKTLHSSIDLAIKMLSASDFYSLESLSTCELRMSFLEIVRDLNHNHSFTDDCRSKISMAGGFKSTIMYRLKQGKVVKRDVKFL